MAKKPTPWKPAIGNLVRVVDYARATWRIINIDAGGLAHLTKLNADPRIDYYNVPVAQLIQTESILG